MVVSVEPPPSSQMPQPQAPTPAANPTPGPTPTPLAKPSAKTAPAATPAPATNDSRSSFLTDARNLIQSNVVSYVKRLAEAVAIPSVSTDLDKRPSCFEMANLLNGWIEQLGGKSEKVLVGFQELDDGTRFDLPPVILSEFRDGPARNGKPTLLIYGHYDVQAVEELTTSSTTSSPPSSAAIEKPKSNANSTNSTTSNPNIPSNSWSADPFILTERSAKGVSVKSFEHLPVNGGDSKANGGSDAANAAQPDGAKGDHADDTVSNDSDSTLIGRGVVCEKGPLLAWLWAVEAFREVGTELPVNVKFMIEGMQESRSECVQDLIQREATTRDGFLTDVNYVIVPSGSWSTVSRPTLVYGLRGNASFEVDVRSSVTAPNHKALHSGRWAGALNEPMGDVIHLLNYMQEEIESVPGCTQMHLSPADQIDPSERALYNAVRADLPDLGIITLDETIDPAEASDAPGTESSEQGQQQQARENVVQALMRKSCMPAFSIHGIEGGYSGPGVKPVIPSNACGKFSIRFIPVHLHSTGSAPPLVGSPQVDQLAVDNAKQGLTNDDGNNQEEDQPLVGANTTDADQSQSQHEQTVSGMDDVAIDSGAYSQLASQIEATVTDMLRQRFESLDSGNELVVTSATCDPWLTNPDSTLMRAGQSAILRAHGVRPDLLRDGSSIPVVPMLQNALGRQCNVMLVPAAMAPHDAPAFEESIAKQRYVNSIYSSFVMLAELAREHADSVKKQMAAAPPVRKGPLGRLKDIWYGLS